MICQNMGYSIAFPEVMLDCWISAVSSASTCHDIRLDETQLLPEGKGNRALYKDVLSGLNEHIADLASIVITQP